MRVGVWATSALVLALDVLLLGWGLKQYVEYQVWGGHWTEGVVVIVGAFGGVNAVSIVGLMALARMRAVAAR